MGSSVSKSIDIKLSENDHSAIIVALFDKYDSSCSVSINDLLMAESSWDVIVSNECVKYQQMIQDNVFDISGQEWFNECCISFTKEQVAGGCLGHNPELSVEEEVRPLLDLLPFILNLWQDLNVECVVNSMKSVVQLFHEERNVPTYQAALFANCLCKTLNYCLDDDDVAPNTVEEVSAAWARLMSVMLTIVIPMHLALSKNSTTDEIGTSEHSATQSYKHRAGAIVTSILNSRSSSRRQSLAD